MQALNHLHPGTLMRDEVLVPLGLSIPEAAKRFGVSEAALSPVLNGQATIAAELAEGLERAGVSTARFWMALQTEYDQASLPKKSS